MKVLITGAAGLLGHGLVEVFQREHEVITVAHAEMDVTDAAAVRAKLRVARPDVVIHAAAIPDVDVCELEPEKAHRVNVEGTQNVAEAAGEIGAAVAFISSDAVFDGKKTSPYVESDRTNPISVYGRTKESGEEIVGAAPKHWIFRIPVLFGPGKINFVEKGLQKIAKGEGYVVAADQIGGAAYTLDIAEKMMEVMASGKYEIFHLANSGVCSRLDLAQRAAKLAGLDVTKVIGKPMVEMKRPGPRVAYSVMEMGALKKCGIAPPRTWEAALDEYIRSRNVA
jgi:dTDP-4-dehydrorhamnose reductase